MSLRGRICPTFAGSRFRRFRVRVPAREARHAGTALGGARTARRYARTSRRSTSRLRARRRPCEGFLDMRSDAYASMRERARFFVAISSLGRLGSASFPDPRKDANFTASSPLDTPFSAFGFLPGTSEDRRGPRTVPVVRDEGGSGGEPTASAVGNVPPVPRSFLARPSLYPALPYPADALEWRPCLVRTCPHMHVRIRHVRIRHVRA